MTVDELAGRMAALEVMAMTSLGLYLANAANDPQFERSRALLGHMRGIAEQKALELPEDQRGHCLDYADELLSQALENLRLLRGGR